jgi:hypothetical protein
LYQTLSSEFIKLITIRNTRKRILLIELDSFFPEFERILNIADFYEEGQHEQGSERYSIIDCYHLIMGVDKRSEDGFYKMIMWQNQLLKEQDVKSLVSKENNYDDRSIHFILSRKLSKRDCGEIVSPKLFTKQMKLPQNHLEYSQILK